MRALALTLSFVYTFSTVRRNAVRISTDKFSHNPTEKTFYAEASDLPHGWMDGITLVSPRGTTASFFLKETKYDASHEDITEWVFVCSTNPKVIDYTLVIFND